MPLFLGIDVGTQSTKAVVWDSDSDKICSTGSVAYGILPTDVQGRAEQDPQTWVDVRIRSIISSTGGNSCLRRCMSMEETQSRLCF